MLGPTAPCAYARGLFVSSAPLHLPRLGARTRGSAAETRQRGCTATKATRCPYEVLGVDSSASASDIKKTFRALALQLHPDVAGADKERAFIEAKEAYELLSDAKLRAQYDAQRAGTAAHGGGRGPSRVHDMWTVVVEAEGLDEEDMVGAGGRWGFHSWHAASGGSWQSSWQANRKKQTRAAAAAAAKAAAAAMGAHDRQRAAKAKEDAELRRMQRMAALRAGMVRAIPELTELLSELDDSAVAALGEVFGKRLQHLHTPEELAEFLEGLELMRMQGLDLRDFAGFVDTVQARGGTPWHASGGEPSHAVNGRGQAAGKGRAGRQRKQQPRPGTKQHHRKSSRVGTGTKVTMTYESLAGLEELLEALDVMGSGEAVSGDDDDGVDSDGWYIEDLSEVLDDEDSDSSDADVAGDGWVTDDELAALRFSGQSAGVVAEDTMFYRMYARAANQRRPVGGSGAARRQRRRR